MKPTGGLPLAAACSFTSAINAAQSGAEKLVPALAPVPSGSTWPLLTMSKNPAEMIATSGKLLLDVEPWLADTSTSCCQLGRAWVVQLPPPLPAHAVSDCHALPDPVMDKTVPPTMVI